jgi:hypothetical protein
MIFGIANEEKITMRRIHDPFRFIGTSRHSWPHAWLLAAISCTLLLVEFGPNAMGANRETAQADFFVATDGNDAWTGTLSAPNADKTDGPFASLSRARDAVRARKAQGPPAKGVTVMVRGGNYFLNETLAFGPQDSGTKDCPVSYVAYPGEQPVISGGKVIDAEWKPYQDKIQVCVIPEVAAGRWYFRQLSVNGKRQKRSRTPDEGEYLRGDAVSATSFKFREGHMRKWHNLEDVEVVCFHSWNETRFRIASLDESSRVVQFRDPKARHIIGWKGCGGPNRYYLENTLEGVTQPGEWYLDRQTGQLYYWPLEDDVASCQVIAPAVKQLVRFEGSVDEDQYVEHLHVSGFTFCDADWHLPEFGYPDCGDVGDIVDPSAITYQAARFCKFTNNCVKNTGAYAVEVTGDGNLISDNQIFDTGGGGVITRSFGKERNEITYNHIHHCGLVYPSAVGINIDDGGGLVAHNLIHDITHSGVYGRHWATATQPKERRNQEQGLVIEFNEIFDVMLNINDGAGIFIRDANIVINNNLIHDVYAGGSRCPGWGIYLGCETRDTKVTNNVVYNTLENVHVWYYDRDVLIENNIFVGSRKCQINYQNPANLKHENIKFLRNIVYCTETGGHLFSVSGERSLPVESDYNIMFSTIGCVLNDPIIKGLPGVQSFKDWKEQGFDAHSITADPLFVDLENHDYSLKPDSPAFKVGFQPIDLSHVGLRGRDQK